MSTTIIQRLTALRQSLGLSQRAFAKISRISNSTISLWEKGSTVPSYSTLCGLAAMHGVSEKWLVTGEGEMRSFKISGGEIINADGTQIPSFFGSIDRIITIPMLTTQASSGDGTSVEDYIDDLLGGLPISAMWLRFMTGIAPENVCGILIDGDSMSPTLVPNEIVIIDKTSTSTKFKDGIWVLRHDNTLTIKRIQRAENRYQATSDNPNYHSYPLEETDQLLARVIGNYRRF